MHTHGIHHQLSCPHTPEQNGIAERKHRHIVELGLAVLFEASLPLSYWVEAFTTVNFLINRLPSKALNMHSPYSLLYNKQPDYTFFRVGQDVISICVIT